MRGVYIGADATNPTLILRLRSFLRAGIDLTAFTFRRTKFNADYQPEWTNIHLGNTVDRKYWKRVPALLRAAFTLWRNRKTIRQSEFVYCRNFDLLVLGLWAKCLCAGKITLVYEIEDVQEVFFKKNVTGAFFRFVERRILNWVDLVVCMSPGFVTGYLEPVQNYSGPHYILENKLQPHGMSTEPTEAGAVWKTVRDKWVIGWFGTLRCPKSMKILEGVAEALGDRVEIYTRGYPTETGLEAYMEIVNRHPNWTYEGEYTIPQDLQQMYGRVHFSWCLDFLDEAGNSPLLLACRMYQGGYFGAVPLVVKGWEMDRWLREKRVGFAISEPYAESIVELLTSLDWTGYEAQRDRMMEIRDDAFLEDGSDTRGMLDMIADITEAKHTRST